MKYGKEISGVLITLSVTCGVEAQSLKIGTVGALAPGGKAEVAETNLKGFVKTETDLTAEVEQKKNWLELADQLAAKSIQVGIFQSHEFVWAQQRQASIKPLVLAVRGPRYPTLYIVVSKSSSIASVADLRGKAIAVPAGSDTLRLYIESEVAKKGQKLDSFVSEIKTPDNSEDGLDDAVDGAVAAAVVDRASLDSFKRRKPARFANLKELSRTELLIPAVIAYADGSLDDSTRQRFQDGLVKANRTDRGQSLLSRFKLNGFEAPPADFTKVAAETLRAFPVPSGSE